MSNHSRWTVLFHDRPRLPPTRMWIESSGGTVKLNRTKVSRTRTVSQNFNACWNETLSFLRSSVFYLRLSRQFRFHRRKKTRDGKKGKKERIIVAIQFSPIIVKFINSAKCELNGGSNQEFPNIQRSVIGIMKLFSRRSIGLNFSPDERHVRTISGRFIDYSSNGGTSVKRVLRNEFGRE